MSKWLKIARFAYLLPLTLLLAGCPIEDRINKILDNADTVPPEITQQAIVDELLRLLTGTSVDVTYAGRDNEAFGADNQQQFSLSCFGPVEVTDTNVSTNGNTFEVTYQLTTSVVEGDTAYGCQFNLEDSAGNKNSSVFNGLVVLTDPSVDNNPPILNITPSDLAEFDEGDVFVVTVEAEDDVGFPEDPISVSCTEGVEATIADIVIDGKFVNYKIELDAPEIELDTNFTCDYEATDTFGNTVISSPSYIARENGASSGIPVISGDLLKDIDSGSSESVELVLSASRPSFVDFTEITECTSDVQFALTNSTLGLPESGADLDVALIENESTYLLTAPQVSVDTPYTCELQGGIVLGEGDVAQLTGTILAPDTSAADNAFVFVFNEVVWGEQLTPVVSYLQEGDTAETAVIYQPPETVVSAVSFPSSEHSCAVLLEDGITDSGIGFQFDCTRSEDGTLNIVSRAGEGTWNLASTDGSPSQPLVGFDQSGNALTVTSEAALNTYTGNIYDPNGQLIFLTDAEGNFSSNLNHIPFVGVPTQDQFGNETSDAIRPALSISVADGLSSMLEIYALAGYVQFRTILYTTPEAGRITGIFVVSDVPPANGADSVQVRMVPEEIVDYIDSNGIIVNQVAVVAVKQDVAEEGGNTPPTPVPEIFDPEVPPVGDPPPEVGVSISSTVAALTPQSVCPADTDDQPKRCTAGTTEFLLSMNFADEVALYDSFNGDAKGFFLSGETFSHLGTDLSGVLASQGPDHCVMYADGDGNLLLFDTVDNSAPEGNDQLLGDGQGNLMINGGALLEGSAQSESVVSYRGFDFYSANNSTDWKLFISVQSQDGGVFTNQIVRYDYALDGNTVLSNPLVIATDTAFSNQDNVFYSIQVANQKVYVTQDVPSGPDSIRVFQPDGTELDELFDFDTVVAGSADIREVRQITEAFTGDLAVVNFSSFTPALRVVDRDTPGTLVRSYALSEQLRGVAHLRNGDYLIAGQLDIDRSVLNQFTGETRKVPDGSPRTTFNRQGEQIGRACLP